MPVLKHKSIMLTRTIGEVNTIGEKHARVAIVIISVSILLAFALFLGDARLFGVLAQQPTPEEILAPAIEDLARQEEEKLLLLKEIQQLEKQISSLQKTLEAKDNVIEGLETQNLQLTDDVVMEYSGEFKTTAYCCEVYPHICGGNGVTASGTKPTPGLTAAADWSVFEPGTWLYIEDVGVRRVEDSGSAIKGSRLDVAVDTHENALRWKGYGTHRVWVLNLG